ncbi:Uncharacterized protein TCM_025103 [Theobroma cacao]|uniref:Uncharacterized protein n=1 Tax=Theobroma cacao TaxID=3641 RepID=A0A061EZA2_THECC|nr:Uncharacterized protein TCM_025103 [Theobroma cacao]
MLENNVFHKVRETKWACAHTRLGQTVKNFRFPPLCASIHVGCAQSTFCTLTLFFLNFFNL